MVHSFGDFVGSDVGLQVFQRDESLRDTTAAWKHDDIKTKLHGLLLNKRQTNLQSDWFSLL